MSTPKKLCRLANYQLGNVLEFHQDFLSKAQGFDRVSTFDSFG